MKTYFECWVRVAADLFRQALAGAPELEESPSKPFEGMSLGFSASLAGDDEGRIIIALDSSILETPLLGEGVDQRAGWSEVLKESFDAAAGELLAKTGRKCRVEKFEEATATGVFPRGFRLKSAERSWTILMRDELKTERPAAETPQVSTTLPASAEPSSVLSPGLELLLDVELEASLRFGGREMPLGEILDLGPGDVVQLDRQVSDPVDLIVGDKIVARGEVVLVNGNFGLRISEVAAPTKRLESIRCLF